jgi:hypothetical protein
MVVFDLESVPLAASLAAPYPREQRQPPSTYKSDEAIAKWYAGDEVSWREGRAKECALNPRLGRVVCIGYGTPDGRDEVELAREEFGEKLVLAEFWARVFHHGRIAGFNSHGFDFPFLLTRSLIQGVVPKGDVTQYLRRYNYTPHFDVRMALTGWDSRATGTLTDWCTAFGIDAPIGKGSDVFASYQQGDFDAIELHCRTDIAATAALVQRVAPVFGVTA